MKRSDAELMRDCAAGDLSALQELYQRYGRQVYRACLRILGNRVSAEDVSQEVFLSLTRVAKSFDRRSSLGTWLYRAALNRCLNWRRRCFHHNRWESAACDDALRLPDPERWTW